MSEVGAGEHELVVRVNGHLAAYMSYYGRDTARDRALRQRPYHQSNTSCSVLVRERATGATPLHLLFDVGLGVVNGLEAARDRIGAADVDALFLSHPHLDHFAELDRLAFALRGVHEDRGEQGWALPLYCTDPCAERVLGPRGAFPWLGRADGPVRRRPVTPCVPIAFPLPGGEALTVTGVSVYHGSFAPGAVIWVVDGCGKKVVFGWDVLRVVEAPEQPNDAERAMHVTALPAAHAGLVRDADVLFLDSTTWHPRPAKHHISIREGLLLAQRWRAQRLYWVHYSGSEDLDSTDAPLNPVLDLPEIRVARALTDPELRWLAGRVSGLLGRDVRYAYAGMTLPDTEGWPAGRPGAFT